jgi:hypothetical protein
MTWSGDVADFGDEVPGHAIELAFHSDQPRGPDGKWIKASSIGAVGPLHPEPPDHDSFDARQRAARAELLGDAQKRIMAALTADPSQMTDAQLYTASRVISSLTPHDYSDIRERTHRIVPHHIANHVTNEISDSLAKLQNDDNHDARSKLIGHVALILGALAVSFITAGLGAPVAIATLAGLVLPVANEVHDFRLDFKKDRLVQRAS